MQKTIRVSSALLLMSCGALAATSFVAFGRASLAANGLSNDTTQRQKAIEALRAQGESGWKTLQTTYADDIAQHRANGLAKTPNWENVRHALYKVSGQRDSWASGLYWYTDLEAAKAAAKKSGKPILSLRLLGRLDEELSCANSRFFRTALYANQNISQTLRNDFVLHWSSERPVPVVTIDMGDGRVMKRTLTGNSVHYLMDSQGRVLDALPGLYGPGAFAKWLGHSRNLNVSWLALPAEKRDEWLRNYHKAQIEYSMNAYADDYVKAYSVKLNDEQRANFVKGLAATSFVSAPPAPSAWLAGARAMAKSAAEMPILNSTRVYGTLPESMNLSVTESVGTPRPYRLFDASSINSDFDNISWARLATLYTIDAQLDGSSQNLMCSKMPQQISDQTNKNPGIPFSRIPIVGVLQSFQSAMAIDTVRNKYRMHLPIHKWFADGEATDFETLNRRVYSELFLTPRNDQWLGLAPIGTYTALQNDGVS